MFEPRKEDDDINKLPRRVSKAKEVVLKRKRKAFTKNTKCNHADCARVETAWNKTDSTRFINWRNSQEAKLKSLEHEEELRFLKPMIHFDVPVKDEVKSNRYSYSLSNHFTLPGPGGVGSYRVCRAYFRWFFCFGPRKLQTIMRILHESGDELWVEHKQNYKGYKNTDEEPKWIEEWAQWAIDTKSMVRSHYTRDKDTVYFEAENGVKHTWTSLWNNWIKDTQPAAFDNWVRKKGAAKDPTISKPKPCLYHFLKVIPKTFKCKPKRVSQDVCNGCEKLAVLLRAATTSKEKEEIQNRLDSHMHRARLMYQLNTHFKKLSTKSFEVKKILIRRGTPPMEHKGTFQHVEFDFDLDHPEIFHVLNMVYFKRKITVKSLNVIQHPPDPFGSRKVFAWSGMVGGKKAEETIQCLEHTFHERGIGAERCFLNCDGALLTYKLLRFAAFCILPKNPRRYFRALHVLSPETGHSRLEADQVNQQAAKHYKKSERWSKCSDRVDYINEHTDIEMKEWKYFGTLPTLYDDLFLDQSKWVDQFGKGALIKADKGMIYEFGESMVWNTEKEEFEWVAHPAEMWIRCHHDLKKQLRKIRILKAGWDKLPAAKWAHLRRDRVSFPPIKRDTLKDTLEIVNFFENAEELRQYYTPAEIDESGEVKKVPATHNYGKITTKIVRRQQFERMLETNQAEELDPYERKEAGEDSGCSVDVQVQIYDVDSETATKVRDELKNHGLSTSGIGTVVRQRWRDHLRDYHPFEFSQVKTCGVKVDLELDIDRIGRMKVKELKEAIKNHGFKQSSTRKQELKQELLEHFKEFHGWIEAQDSVSGQETEAEKEDSDFVSDHEMDLESELETDTEMPAHKPLQFEVDSESSSDGLVD